MKTHLLEENLFGFTDCMDDTVVPLLKDSQERIPL